MTGSFVRADYYKILQVDQDAHPAVLRSAYRTLMRGLGKHPDLGGQAAEARTIIEAYTTLGHPERRRAYDGWLAAHATVAVPEPALPRAITAWIQRTLPDYRLSPKAPFARSFDLVLEGHGAFSPRLYVKGYPVVARAQWPTILVLCRAVAVARSGLMPSTDAVLIVANQVQALEQFLEAARHYASPWAWNRSCIAVSTLDPPRLGIAGRAGSAALRRLANAVGELGGAEL